MRQKEHAQIKRDFSESRLDFGYLVAAAFKLLKLNFRKIAFIAIVLYLPISFTPALIANAPLMKKISSSDNPTALMEEVMGIINEVREGGELEDDQKELWDELVELSGIVTFALILPFSLFTIVNILMSAAVIEASLAGRDSPLPLLFNLMLRRIFSIFIISVPGTFILLFLLLSGLSFLIPFVYVFYVFILLVAAFRESKMKQVYLYLSRTLSGNFLWTMIMSFVFVTLALVLFLAVSFIFISFSAYVYDTFSIEDESLNYVLLGVQYFSICVLSSFFTVILPASLFFNLDYRKRAETEESANTQDV